MGNCLITRDRVLWNIYENIWTGTSGGLGKAEDINIDKTGFIAFTGSMTSDAYSSLKATCYTNSNKNTQVWYCQQGKNNMSSDGYNSFVANGPVIKGFVVRVEYNKITNPKAYLFY